MNAAAIILGIAGAIVTTIAVSAKQSGGMRAFAPAGAPPDSDAFPQLPPPRAAIDSIPSHPVEVVPGGAPSTAIDITPQQVRTPKDAAKELLSYVSPLIRNGRADALGTKEAPNTIIQALQTDMRKVTADGVYGPKTAARGKELLGMEFPARAGAKRVVPKQAPPPLAAAPKPKASPAPASASIPPALAELKPPAAPPPPDVPVSEHSPKEAAEALLMYVTGAGVDWGSKPKPNPIIRDAQKAMQKLTADGIYGPKTRDRGKQLTGKTFPPRK